MMVSRDVHVLLAGGAADEMQALSNVLKTMHTPARVHLRHLTNADEVLGCLRGEGAFRKPFHASLLFLDVDGLAEGGTALLSKIKADGKLAHIPVVMLATHQSEHELRRAYDEGASCSVAKPVDPQELLEALQVTNEFWLTVAKLPSE